jgi:hypothetical protein
MVLMRTLSERLPLTGKSHVWADTLYVGYPFSADPPPEFFKDLSYGTIVFAPSSKRLPRKRDLGATITIASVDRQDNPDTVEIAVEWSAIRAEYLVDSTAERKCFLRMMARMIRNGESWDFLSWEPWPSYLKRVLKGAKT